MHVGIYESGHQIGSWGAGALLDADDRTILLRNDGAGIDPSFVQVDNLSGVFHLR
jgi:hypothetical protein